MNNSDGYSKFSIVFSEEKDDTPDDVDFSSVYQELLNDASSNDGATFSIIPETTTSNEDDNDNQLRPQNHISFSSYSSPYVQKYSPSSNKILMMSAARESLDDYDINIFSDIKSTLVLDHGWEDLDIKLRFNEKTRQYKTLGFDDFINIDEYGVVVILAQGFYMVQPMDYTDPSSPLEKYLFTQIRAVDAFALVPVSSHFDIHEEIAHKRIIPRIQVDILKKSFTMYLYMRHDLWFDHLQKQPHSIIYLMNCNDDIGGFMFGPKDIGNFIGWDGPASASMVTDVLWTFPIMALLDKPLYDVWYNTVSPKLIGLPSQLELYPDDEENSVYLPSWLDISVLNKPADCTNIKIDLSYEDESIFPPNPVSLTEDKNIDPHSFYGLVPGETIEITVSALDKDDIPLKTKITDVDLSTGGNDITIDLPDTLYNYRFWEHTYTTAEEIEPQGYNWHGDHLYRWRYWLVFDAVEGVNSYKVTVQCNSYPNDYITNNNPHTVSGMPSPFFLDDDPTLSDEYDAGKRFFLVGGQECFYSPDDGPSDCYEKRDEIIEGVEAWTYNIVPNK